MSSRRTRACALGIALAGVLAPAAPAQLGVGVSDQHETAFSDIRFRSLPVDHVRLIVPWDAALTDPGPTDAWLKAATARGLRPMVAFERSRGDQCPDAPCHAPSSSEFADAFRAFRLRWPQVTEFAA